MKYFLAIDGGGTKTHVICADENDQVVGEGFSGPTNLTATQAGAAGFNLREGIRQALLNLPQNTEIEAMVMGLAGIDTQLELENAQTVFSQVLEGINIKKFKIVNDIVIALENATNAHDAFALISGTGSNSYGRNSAGETAKASGYDFLLSDQGSGYAIGRAVLRKAVKSFDGRGEKTVLEQFVCQHFHINSIAELKDKVHHPLLTKTEIAELAQVCLRAFDQGDQVAKAIFDHNIDELVIMGTTIIHKLHLESAQPDCVLVGSITKIAYVENALSERLRAVCPGIKIVVPTKAPVFGALKMAHTLV